MTQSTQKGKNYIRRQDTTIPAQQARVAQQVPAAIAFREVRHGKTRAAKAVLSPLGMQHANVVKVTFDTKAVEQASSTSLSIVNDNPTDTPEIAAKIDKGKQESAHSFYTPKGISISSMNEACLRKLC